MFQTPNHADQIFKLLKSVMWIGHVLTKLFENFNLKKKNSIANRKLPQQSGGTMCFPENLRLDKTSEKL